jgi:hypothetical protein
MLSSTELEDVKRCVVEAERRIQKESLSGSHISFIPLPSRYWYQRIFQTYSKNVVKTAIQFQLEQKGYRIIDTPIGSRYMTVTYVIVSGVGSTPCTKA